MQILQKALDWFKSLFWKVSFATTLIRVIANFIIIIILMFFNVKSAKGQYQLMFAGGDGAHPGRTSGRKRILGGWLSSCWLCCLCSIHWTYQIWKYHLLDFWIIEELGIIKVCRTYENIWEPSNWKRFQHSYPNVGRVGRWWVISGQTYSKIN